jgi:hypothetical protein
MQGKYAGICAVRTHLIAAVRMSGYEVVYGLEKFVTRPIVRGHWSNKAVNNG